MFKHKPKKEELFDWKPYLGKTVVYQHANYDFEFGLCYDRTPYEEGVVKNLLLPDLVKIDNRWMKKSMVKFHGEVSPSPVKAHRVVNK